MPRQVVITDVTLRDGSHPMEHRYSPEQVSTIASALDTAGVPVIEVAHGDGVGGSSIQYGRSRFPEFDVMKAGGDAIKQGKMAFLFVPGIARSVELQLAIDAGGKIARVATHCTEADCAEEHIKLAKKAGLEVVGFLMMAHMATPETIAEQAKMMESYGADIVYLVDSAGAMMPDEVRARIEAMRESIGVAVGFHGHNNLSLAVANSLAAIDEGATWIDASLAGFGAGAGNTPLEVLVAVLNKRGVDTGIDLYKVMDAAEELVWPIMPFPVRIDRDSLTIGVAGVYSTFLLHAQHASQRFGVDTRDILLEAGRRELVGGQEDMLIDIAYSLSQKEFEAETHHSD